MGQENDRRKERAGSFVKQPEGFKAFIPKPLPPDPQLEMSERRASLLAKAERHLARLDSLSEFVPDPNRFVQMYVRQEAVLSSQIEGTQASLSDLLNLEATQHGKSEGDVGDVVRYLRALHHGFSLLEKLPICTRFFCAVHHELVKESRGGEAACTPGQFRRSQNWIGGTSPENAIYVPPPHNEMQAAMGALEAFLHAKKSTPLLIEIAYAHAQFETIHPFLDGNGRVGRLLITFLLSQHKLLAQPLLYLSHYFKENRDAYYTRLQSIRTNGEWEEWVDFFLTAVAEVAEEATQRAGRIVRLRTEDQQMIRERFGLRVENALRLHDTLLGKPIVTSRIVQEFLDVTQPTADKLLADFVDEGILQSSARQWGRTFSYRRYLEMFSG